jgi:hypothetical protein
MANFRITQEVISNGAGFIAKQLFCYQGISPVRQHLTNLVTEVARTQLGILVASLLGAEVGTLLAVAVTCIVGDMIYYTIREIVMAIIQLAKYIITKKIEVPSIPLMKDMICRIASYCAYFFSNILFCDVSMGAVRKALTFTFTKIMTPQSSLFSFGFAQVAMAHILTPPITFFLGEIFGTIVGEVTYEKLTKEA